jgi:hypothetical protein
MPPPSSRRASVQRQKAAAAAPPAEPVEPVEQIDVEMPVDGIDSAAIEGDGADQVDSGSGADEAAPGQSGRRKAGRSARRSAQQSAQRSARKSRPLTPEEQAARRAAIRTGLIILGSVACLALLFTAIYFLAFRKDERKIAAEGVLTSTQGDLDGIQAKLAKFDPAGARALYDQALKRLADSSDLGNAQPNPNPDTVVSVPLAIKAYELKVKVEATDEEIKSVARKVAVDERYKGLSDRFAKLRDLDDTALDLLDKDIQAFLENPVDAGGVRNETAVLEHSNAVGKAKNCLAPIALERETRLKTRTKDQERRVTEQVDGLVKGERFQEALALIDQSVRDWPLADFNRLRTFATETHDKAWAGVEQFISTKRKDANAPGVTDADRAGARTAARERLQRVIDSWGIETTVGKARDLLREFTDEGGSGLFAPEK